MPNTFEAFLEIFLTFFLIFFFFFQNGFQHGKHGLWQSVTTVITRETRALADIELSIDGSVG